MSVKITEEQARQMLEDNTPPLTKTPAPHAFTFFAELDTTKAPLTYVKPFEVMELSLPPGLTSHAREVLIRMFRCFARAGNVSEGLIGDWMLGFTEPTLESLPLPENITLSGLMHLVDAGYVTFKTKNGETIDPRSSAITKAWVRYTPKLLELVYEKA